MATFAGAGFCANIADAPRYAGSVVEKPSETIAAKDE
jgi:hypothetical protein